MRPEALIILTCTVITVSCGHIPHWVRAVLTQDIKTKLFRVVQWGFMRLYLRSFYSSAGYPSCHVKNTVRATCSQQRSISTHRATVRTSRTQKLPYSPRLKPDLVSCLLLKEGPHEQFLLISDIHFRRFGGRTGQPYPSVLNPAVSSLNMSR